MIVLQFNCPGWTSKILSSSGQQVAPQSSSPFADPPAALEGAVLLCRSTQKPHSCTVWAFLRLEDGEKQVLEELRGVL